MIQEAISIQRLMLSLGVYFLILFGGILTLGLTKPEWLSVLPLGGTDAIEIAGLGLLENSLVGLSAPAEEVVAQQVPTASQIGLVALYLAFSLGGTILVMLPVTWSYIATKREIGYQKSFARALIVLPICAATIVLLIQNNLALAFGLAAMVAAIRFRVVLEEAIDRIYIFAAICVGLAAGIGYLGVGAIMAVFFCFTNVILWHMDYGKNPLDDARSAKRQAKLDAPRA